MRERPINNISNLVNWISCCSVAAFHNLQAGVKYFTVWDTSMISCEIEDFFKEKPFPWKECGVAHQKIEGEDGVFDIIGVPESLCST